MINTYVNALNEYYNFAPGEDIKNITFQVTDDCCCRCSYCYQINKSHNYMNKETAEKCINLIFDAYEKNDPSAPINQNTKGLCIDFIGGEPLMNIEIIDFISTQIMDRCIKENHPWLFNTVFSMISNGTYYFTTPVQNYLNKFGNLVDFGVTIDGPEEIHNKDRYYPDGTGNFKDAFNCYLDLQKQHKFLKTKITLNHNNLKNLFNIFQFFVENKADIFIASIAHEEQWSIEEGQIFYKELIKCADYLLANDICEKDFSLFDEMYGEPKDEDDLTCWCGGTKSMLAFAPDGTIYSCLRFAPSSLGEGCQNLSIGSADKGFCYDELTLNNYKMLQSINRRTKCDDECFYCPIASGCPECAAWNFQESGQLNFKSKNGCNLIKAQSLANAYFWNKYYEKNNIDRRKKINLSKEECLKYISEQEYYELKKMEEKS